MWPWCTKSINECGDIFFTRFPPFLLSHTSPLSFCFSVSGIWRWGPRDCAIFMTFQMTFVLGAMETALSLWPKVLVRWTVSMALWPQPEQGLDVLMVWGQGATSLWGSNHYKRNWGTVNIKCAYPCMWNRNVYSITEGSKIIFFIVFKIFSIFVFF